MTHAPLSIWTERRPRREGDPPVEKSVSDLISKWERELTSERALGLDHRGMGREVRHGDPGELPEHRSVGLVERCEEVRAEV